MISKVQFLVLLLAQILYRQRTVSFVLQWPHRRHVRSPSFDLQATATPPSLENVDDLKKKLFQLVQAKLPNTTAVTVLEDPVLADPITKQGVRIFVDSSPSPPLFGDYSDDGETKRRNRRSIKYVIQSPSHTYSGSSDTFWNLLEPINHNDRPDPTVSKETFDLSGSSGSGLVLMRDMFTSPVISFVYERGWRQAFQRLGFPGLDQEAQMAMDYFAPAMKLSENSKVLVDMSCGSGLFTRLFAKSGQFHRVLGCDYSESMLLETRQRIERDPELCSDAKPRKRTRLDLIRLDVGHIPIKDASVDALHAGAAMHCWPDLDAACSEIYRVLQPGGRYFATTVLASWTNPLPSSLVAWARQFFKAFQNFESTEQLKSIMVSGGFDPDKVKVEVVGRACVILRCEK